MVQFDDSALNARLNDIREKGAERAAASLAPQYGYEHIDLHGYTINPTALATIDEQTARGANIAGFELLKQYLSVAITDPNNIKTKAAITALQQKGFSVHIYMSSNASLEHAWERYADITTASASKKGTFEMSGEDIEKLITRIKKESDVATILQEITTANNSYRTTSTMELIFAGALALRASDIHIEPEDGSIRLRYRFDGVLHDIIDIDSYLYGRMISRLKLLSGMILNQKAEAQDGRFTFTAGSKEVEVRSSVIPGAYGESIVMRLLDPTIASFKMERLNLNQQIAAIIERELKKPNGLIITTGPTGSGKTTALYAFLQEVHKEGVKIITIENPVEYKVEGIVQTQIDGDYTFSSGLRALLRQDPDVILVGEVRDAEVAETAMQAAQTGHLVLTTMHTNSAVAAFMRLMDLGIDPRMFGSAVNLILGQRLVRILCESCKVPHPITPEEQHIMQAALADHPHADTVPIPTELYTAPGCEVCNHTGFKGRTGIYEGIVMDEMVEEVVLRDPREHTILEAAKPQGIPTMLQDGIEKVILGLTSLEELGRVVELPYASSPTPNTPVANTRQADDDFLKHVV